VLYRKRNASQRPRLTSHPSQGDTPEDIDDSEDDSNNDEEAEESSSESESVEENESENEDYKEQDRSPDEQKKGSKPPDKNIDVTTDENIGSKKGITSQWQAAHRGNYGLISGGSASRRYVFANARSRLRKRNSETSG
jgi:hypothetical protein